MIRFFRKIRHQLLAEGSTGRYFKYAFGEILLVMIGILLALQVNNWNIDKTNRIREKKYLTNIVVDLKKDLIRLDYLIKFRTNRLKGDQKLLQQMNGMPVNDFDELTKSVVNTLMEENFIPNNSTFLELSSSGNLNLISNDSIKFLLLELDELYKVNKLSIEHETFDYREYISKSAIQLIDLNQLFPVFEGTKTAAEQQITKDNFNGLFNNRAYKNGLFITTFMSKTNIEAYEKIKMKSQKIINLIAKEK